MTARVSIFSQWCYHCDRDARRAVAVTEAAAQAAGIKRFAEDSIEVRDVIRRRITSLIDRVATHVGEITQGEAGVLFACADGFHVIMIVMFRCACTCTCMCAWTDRIDLDAAVEEDKQVARLRIRGKPPKVS